MRTRDVLAFLKNELEQIDPPIGRVFAQLRKSADPQAMITDFRFKDPVFGNIIKAFIIQPGNARIRRATTGRNGHSHRLRNITIQGFISLREGNEDDGEDLALEDTFDAIIGRLQQVQRLETQSQGSTFHKGEMDMTPITPARISNHNVLVAELTTVIEDRILGVAVAP